MEKLLSACFHCTYDIRDRSHALYFVTYNMESCRNLYGARKLIFSTYFVTQVTQLKCFLRKYIKCDIDQMQL